MTRRPHRPGLSGNIFGSTPADPSASAIAALVGAAAQDFVTTQQSDSELPVAPPKRGSAVKATLPDDVPFAKSGPARRSEAAIDRLRAERFHQVPLADIQESPHQPRRWTDPEALADLVENARTNGLLQPIVVRTLDAREAVTGARYEVAFGHRRLLAYRQLASDPDPSVAARFAAIPAFVAETDEMDALQARILTSMENRHREDLSAYERAQDILGLRHTLAAHGKPATDDDLTAFYGMRSPGGVSEYRVIAEAITDDVLRAAEVTTADGVVEWALVSQMGKTELSDVARVRDDTERVKRLRRLADAVRRRTAAGAGQGTGARRARPARRALRRTDARYTYEQLRDLGKFVMKLGKPISAKSYTIDEGRKYLRDIEPLVALLAEIAGEKRPAYRPSDPNLPGTYVLLTKPPARMSPEERRAAAAEIDRLAAELRESGSGTLGRSVGNLGAEQAKRQQGERELHGGE